MTPAKETETPARGFVAVAAMAENRVIGIDNKLPWHIPSDLKRFKALTMGATVVMGRRTFESLGSRPLPRRRNIVLSRSKECAPRNAGEATTVAATVAATVEWAASLEEVLDRAGAEPGPLFLIGGAQLYAAAFERGMVESVELTRVRLSPDGDTYFPPFEEDFTLAETRVVEENGICFAFETWTKALPRAGR